MSEYSEYIKLSIDWLLEPQKFFVISILGLAAMLWFRSFWTRGWFAGSLLVAVIVGYVLSTTDAEFVAIVAKPDNVPITIMMFALGFLMCHNLPQAILKWFYDADRWFCQIGNAFTIQVTLRENRSRREDLEPVHCP